MLSFFTIQNIVMEFKNI